MIQTAVHPSRKAESDIKMTLSDAQDFDLIILGGGCAGLSLAMQLAAQGESCPRTLILEARTVYENDRTWCFWDDGSMPLYRLVGHNWRYLTVTTSHTSTTIDCGAMVYCMLPANAFYQEAIRLIAQNDRIELRMGSTISHQPQKLNGRWHVNSQSGASLTNWLIDTRPKGKPQRGGATLWQSFSGREIICDQPRFDPTRVDLMDFSATRRGCISFSYVLPMSATSALIETTIFDPEPFNQAALDMSLSHAVERYVGTAPYKITRQEHGILPMGTVGHHVGQDPSYVSVGLNAGGARPSSGYAFRRIQTWAEQCAASFAKSMPPKGHAVDPILLRAMDSLFLSVLVNNREVGPDLFYALFARANTQRVIRFMSDKGTLFDYIAMAATLPTGLFLKQIPAALLSSFKRTKGA